MIAKNNRRLFKGETDDNGQVVIPNSFLRGEKGNGPAFLLARSPKHGLSLIEFNDVKKETPLFDPWSKTRNRTGPLSNHKS